MRKFLLSAFMLAASYTVVPALAADLAMKAQQPFLIYNGSGAYWGFGTSSRLADSSVNGNTLLANLASSNVMAAGQTVDLEAGYVWGNASLGGFASWYRVYAEGSYQNVAGGVTTPSSTASVVSRWSAQEGFDVNADLVQYVLSAFNWQNPFPGGFSLRPPANVAVAAVPHQYVGAFLVEQGLGGNFGEATGTSWALAGGVRTGWLWQTLNKDGKPNGMAFDMGGQVAWMPRGITFSNVLAANGAALVANPSVSMGTTYSVYAHLLFPSLFGR